MAKKKLDFNLSDTKNLALLCVLVGLVFIIFPVGLITGFTFVVGLVALAFGAFHIYGYFSNEKSNVDYPSRLALGLIFAAIGLYFMINSGFIVGISNFIFGLVVLVFSFFLVQYSLDLERVGYKHWLYSLIAACVCTLLGILVLIDIFPTEAGRMTFIGISLIATGLAQMLSDMMLNRTGFDKSKVKKVDAQLDSSIFMNTFDGVKNTITEVVEKANEKKEDISSEINELADEVKEKVEEIKSDAKDATEEVKEEAEEVTDDAKKIAEAVQDKAKEAKADIKEKAEDVKADVKKTATKASKSANKESDKEENK